jgi:hypothetical protein
MILHSDADRPTRSHFVSFNNSVMHLGEAYQDASVGGGHIDLWNSDLGNSAQESFYESKFTSMSPSDIPDRNRGDGFGNRRYWYCAEL